MVQAAPYFFGLIGGEAGEGLAGGASGALQTTRSPKAIRFSLSRPYQTSSQEASNGSIWISG